MNQKPARDPLGRFATQSNPEGQVTLTDAAEPATGWAPKPELVRVDAADSGYTVALAPGGMIAFALDGSRGAPDLHTDARANRLEIHRSETSADVKAIAYFDNLNYADVFRTDPTDDVELTDDSAEYLNRHFGDIGVYLSDTYGGVEAGSEWDNSAIGIETDLTDLAETFGDIRGVNTDDALYELDSHTKMDALARDLETGAFWQDLREHLNTLEPITEKESA